MAMEFVLQFIHRLSLYFKYARIDMCVATAQLCMLATAGRSCNHILCIGIENLNETGDDFMIYFTFLSKKLCQLRSEMPFGCPYQCNKTDAKLTVSAVMCIYSLCPAPYRKLGICGMVSDQYRFTLLAVVMLHPSACGLWSWAVLTQLTTTLR